MEAKWGGLMGGSFLTERMTLQKWRHFLYSRKGNSSVNWEEGLGYSEYRLDNRTFKGCSQEKRQNGKQKIREEITVLSFWI